MVKGCSDIPEGECALCEGCYGEMNYDGGIGDTEYVYYVCRPSQVYRLLLKQSDDYGLCRYLVFDHLLT